MTETYELQGCIGDRIDDFSERKASRSETIDSIIEYFKSVLPEQKKVEDLTGPVNSYSYTTTLGEVYGWNDCLKEILRRIEAIEKP